MYPHGDTKEALPLLPKPLPSPSGLPPKRSLSRFACLILLFVTIACQLVVLTTLEDLENEPETYNPTFDWDQLPTLPELEYVPCYDGFQCARLELPMDYWNGTTDATISLAVLKLPANVPVDHHEYRGPILVNPGGPGGSGVTFAYGGGRKLQSIVQGEVPGTSGIRSYDIIGFDPRGIGLTSPAVDCSGGFAASYAWRMRIMEEGTLVSSDAALGRLWSMSKALSGRCAEVGVKSIQQYLTTASVARDMLELTEASARWRQKQLQTLRSPIKIDPKKTNLQYWGFSYGSYLGNSFAALFPDRVGRLIVDGVVDAEDYAAAKWYDNLVDTEKDWKQFSENCARVGYPTCPLAEKKDAIAEKVEKRILGLIQRTWHNPIPVYEPYAEVVTWSDIRNLIFAGLYSPLPSWPFIANVLAELEQGKADIMAQLLAIYHSPSCPGANSLGPQDHPFLLPLRNQSLTFIASDPFAGAAIACADGDDRTSTTVGEFSKHIKALQELSPTIGDLWAQIALPCITYDLRANYRFAGPWEGKTAHPVLMIGNTADPVTPLGAAKKMAKGFEGARVLTVDAPGHCSLAAYSPCAVKYIGEYFMNGTLPDEGTVCPSLTKPWGPGPGEIGMSEEILFGQQAHSEIHDAMMLSGGGFGMHGVGGKIDQQRLRVAIAAAAAN